LTRKEYNTIAKTVSSKLFTYLKKSLRDEEVANDLVQESYAKLWEHRKKIKNRASRKMVIYNRLSCNA